VEWTWLWPTSHSPPHPLLRERSLVPILQMGDRCGQLEGLDIQLGRQSGEGTFPNLSSHPFAGHGESQKQGTLSHRTEPVAVPLHPGTSLRLDQS
jgi:hypothetical protein